MITVYACSPGATQLHDAVMSPSINDCVRQIPGDVTVVVPGRVHVSTIQRIWATVRPGEPLPIIQTMPSFIRALALRYVDSSKRFIDEVEAELLLEQALTKSGERFRPSGLSLSRIIRWKQEQQTSERVKHDYPTEGRPAELRDLDRVVRVWQTYEGLKGDEVLDRGDVALELVDSLAAMDTLGHERPLVVLGLHGLAETDKLILHLLSRHGVPCGIRFADHVDEHNRSSTVQIWLQGHGWDTGTHTSESLIATSFGIATATPLDETRRVLGAVKQVVLNGSSPKQIGIVVPNDGSYDQMIIAEANAASIPLDFQETISLANQPSLSAIHLIADVVLERWTTQSIDRLASATAITAQIPIGKMSEAAATFRILGGEGATAWRTTLMRSLDILDATNDMDDRGVQRLRALATQALTALDTLRSAIGEPPKDLTPKQLRTWILDGVCVQCGIHVPQEMVDSFDRYERFCVEHGLDQRPLREHVNQWWSIVQRVQQPRSALNRSGVTVSTANDLRYRAFDKVFALGFVEGVMPTPKADPIERTLLPDITELQDRETYADVVGACAPGGTLTVTWPKQRGNDPTIVSRYVKGLPNLSSSDEIPLDPLSDVSRRLHLSVYDVAAARAEPVVDLQDHQRGVASEELDPQAKNWMNVLTSIPLGPSRLDTVTSCPYAYYAKYILQLDERMDIDEKLSGLERGTLMHSVAQRFYESLQEPQPSEWKTIKDVESAMVAFTKSVDEYLPELETIFNQEREKLPQGYLYDEVERAMYRDTNERSGLLRRWLESEMVAQERSDFRPIAFEVDYKGPIRFKDGVSVDVSLRIDRIDARVVDEGLELRVVDYKSGQGSTATATKVGEGLSTQMPLYAASAVAWFEKRKIPCTVAEWAYHTFGKSIKNEDDPQVKRSTNIQALQDGLEASAEAVSSIRSSRFPVKPLDGACTYCAYAEVCRIEHWGIHLNETEEH